MSTEKIRNFCIIAHIDHGKSTLADRLLQVTGAISERELREQVLDDMDLERERGITIKSSAVRLNYTASDGNTYILNLIDTPGHVDFSYEVSKALSACEGALVLVDAAQGVEAQTVANLYQAMEYDLTIIPVINKIDLNAARPDEIEEQIHEILHLDGQSITRASAKEGVGTDEILERIVYEIDPPKSDPKNPLKALIFDSSFDTYKGVIIYIRVFDGCIRAGDHIKMMIQNKNYAVQEVGVFTPKAQSINELSAGEVGYVICNIRDARQVSIGDTITHEKHPAKEPFPGYRTIRPMVFCGIYPVNSKDFEALRDALDKLALNDASFVYEPETSLSLGFGFRCGFQGLLHMEIAQERLEREYDLNLVITTPSVRYNIETIKGEVFEISSPAQLPPTQKIAAIGEPFISAQLLIPQDSLGTVMEIATARRGIYISTEFLSEDRVKLIYEFPLAEVLVDFYDKLKSATRGYGSMDYEIIGYRHASIVRLDILINDEVCDALSSLVHRDRAESKGRSLVTTLKDLIPRQLFRVALQAAIGGKVIARENVRALSKHVTGKCYGGDITRKRKLWEKQKEGKKRLKRVGKVDVPQEAFLAAFKV